MTLLSKKHISIVGVCLLGLLLLSPNLGHSSRLVSGDINIISAIGPNESQTTQPAPPERNENPALLPPTSSGGGLLSFLYGQHDIINSFPFVCSSNFIVVGTRGETTPNVFVVSSANSNEFQFTTASSDVVKDVQEYDKDFSDNLFIMGNRELAGQDSVFYFGFSPLSLMKTYDHEIVLEEDCWFKQMTLLPNGNFLALLQSLNVSTPSLHLYEINPISGEIVNQREFSNRNTNLLAEIDLGGLDYSYQFNSGKILLISHNSTLSDAGVIITTGIFGGVWETYSIPGDVEFWGLVVDQNEYFHVALRRENAQSGETDLDIVKFSESLVLQANFTLSSASQSYTVIDFQINEGSSSDLPFLVYGIWSSATNSGIGFGFVEGNGILQQHERGPSDTYSYQIGEVTFLTDGDVCFGSSEIYNQEATITFHRFSSASYQETIYTNQVFSPFVEADVIGESAADHSIYIGIRDFGKSGVVTFNQYLSLGKELYLDADMMCRTEYYEDAGGEYFIMYGSQGDYFNYHANAILSLYSVEGIKVASMIREENYDVSEIWDQILVHDGFIYLTGDNVQEFSSWSSLIVGYFSFNEFNSPYRKSSNILIDSSVSLNGYLEEGIITGSGKQNDPYILDSLIIDGNEEDTNMYLPGIQIQYYAYYIIQNCIISNLLEGDDSNAGIQLRNIDYFQIQNNSIALCTNGVNIQNGDNGTITNNTIENCRYTGILINQFQNSDNGNNGNEISYNVIRQISDCSETWRGNGIYLSKGWWNQIEHNIITGSCHSGVYLDNCWEDCSNPLVWNNIIQDNDLSGNGSPYNSDLGKNYGNVFKNNVGADDFPTEDTFEIPGFNTGLLLSFGTLSFVGIVMKIARRRKI
ncbi:MAG: hypothetical protein DRI24_23060 [Deltaproteobacteria bacterium]|nr:MAG: hypothetical protein DRI24_23060 [Deltaproteobacteria bacterium]